MLRRWKSSKEMNGRLDWVPIVTYIYEMLRRWKSSKEMNGRLDGVPIAIAIMKCYDVGNMLRVYIWNAMTLKKLKANDWEVRLSPNCHVFLWNAMMLETYYVYTWNGTTLKKFTGNERESQLLCASMKYYGSHGLLSHKIVDITRNIMQKPWTIVY